MVNAIEISKIVEVEMLLASGEIVKYSATKNAEYFQAVLVSIGSLGVILNVTLQCEKAFKLRQVQYDARLDDVRKKSQKKQH